jgi:nucleotide-binding universal stress UspA family protein
MRMVVGVDLRAVEHEWLIQRSVVYAQRIGARIDVVFCAPTPEPEHTARLNELLAAVPAANRGQPIIDPRAPADGLVELSKSADLVVVGSREPLAIDRILHGPMAARVLRHAACPVLVPRGERAPMPNPRLLVGVDIEGPAPSAVLRWADKWAGHLQGTVHVVYAAQAHRGDFASTKDRITAELQKLLETYIGEDRRGGAVVRRGDPEEVLVQTSAEYDLVLVGNRDREGLARMLLGAVAGTIVRRAQCDVISFPTANVGEPPK